MVGRQAGEGGGGLAVLRQQAGLERWQVEGRLEGWSWLARHGLVRGQSVKR